MGLVPAGLAAQSNQEVTALRGETGVDPAPGTLLATAARFSIQRALLPDALVLLSERANVQIAFSPSLLPAGLRVDCDCATANMAQALDRILADTDFGYVELGSQVIILPKAGTDTTLPDGTVSGRVRSEVAVPLADATARLLLAADSTVRWITGTDRLGFFAFRDVAAGDYVVSIARIGYGLHEEVVEVAPGAEVQLDITLAEQAVELSGVLVEGQRSRQRARFEESAGSTVQELDRAELKAIPGVAEADPIRAVEVLPGVTRVTDFAAAFNVRGGSADQNLILLDGVPIFNPFHALGLFSVFNADMVQRAELQAGGFPAEYGGRVSSVLRVESDLGDGELKVDAGVSLIATRVAVGGGLSANVRDRLGLASGRWKVSGRRSYIDVVSRPFLDGAGFPYNLTDLQTGFEGWTKRGNRVRISAYTGRDAVDFRDLEILDRGVSGEDADAIPDAGWRWGNDAVGASWIHPMTGGGALDVHGSLSRFKSDFDFADPGGASFATRISQSLIGADLERRPTPRTRWKSGLIANRMEYRNVKEGVPEIFQNSRGAGWGSAAYSQIHWSPNARWLVEAGVRWDHWRPEDSDATTTVSPRIGLKRFLHDGTRAVRVGGGRYTQFLHSTRDERLPVGLDIWVLAGSNAPALISEQIQLGVESFFGANDGWFASMEGYFRSYDGVVAQNWAEDPSDPDDDLLSGEGRSYGLDLMVRKDIGESTGWVTVSFLKADRTIVDTDSGLDPAPVIEYPPVFDRRLDVDLVLRRQLAWGVEGGLRWNFGTGPPYTRPLAKYDIYRPRMIDLLVDPTYETGLFLGPRNGERYPVRHRLDISFRKVMEKDWGRVTPYLNVVNVYHRKNVMFYFFDYRPVPPVRRGVSMMPFLPTIGVEVSF